MLSSHVYDPSAGSGSVLVASFAADRVTIDRPWAAELAQLEQDALEREVRSYGFGHRQSLCG